MWSRRSRDGSIPIPTPCGRDARGSSVPLARSKVVWVRTHFLMKRLRNVAAEMALHVLAYNLTRVMNIVGKSSPFALYDNPAAQEKVYKSVRQLQLLDAAAIEAGILEQRSST